MINIESLYKKPYALIPFSVKKTQIEEAIVFFEFLKLPENIKQHIDLKISPLHRRGDIGFKHRNPEDDIYNDSKDFFHYPPIIEKHYSKFTKLTLCLVLNIVKMENAAVVAYSHLKALTLFGKPFYRLYLQSF